MRHLLEIPDYNINAFKPLLGRMRLFGKSDPPPPPDYVAAANATAAGSLEAAKYATTANRVDQFTPYGSSTYTKGTTGTPGTFNKTGYDQAMTEWQARPDTPGTPGTPGTPEQRIQNGSGDTWDGTYTTIPGTPGTPGTPSGRGAAPTREAFTTGGTPGNPDAWSQTVKFSPEQQALYDKDLSIKGNLLDVAKTGITSVQKNLSTPFDQGKLTPQVINPGETAQSAILRRMQPQLDRDREALRTQLLNQGLTPGSQAYDTAMARADQQSNDAYSEAALRGISLTQQARQQGIQEESFFRNEPLNTVNALRTGNQVQNPTFGAVPQQATTAGPDILGATTAGYNAQVANTNASNASGAGMMNGLFGLGQAAIPFAFSDERLKTNIRRVGELPNGIGIYVFAFKHSPEVLELGCIAQDVQKIMPDAVREDAATGMLMVNYRRVLV